MAVLVYAEHDNAELNEATLRAIGAAAAIDSDIHVLVAGAGCGGVAEAAARVSGVTKVLVADDDAYAHQLRRTCDDLHQHQSIRGAGRP